jgi:tRNA (mo5U34)-methyltransferase
MPGRDGARRHYPAPVPILDLERRSRKRQLAAGVRHWWHSLDLGDGVITAGHKTPALLQAELAALHLPVLVGKTVLDVGSWDGYFAFEAERRGAQRVVALDYFFWRVDPDALDQHVTDGYGQGRAPARWEDIPDLWSEDTPGKRGFDVAHEALGSRVETVVADFTTMDLTQLGTFDVVLFLGVLYHLRHPLAALERLRAITREVAIIETHAHFYPGLEHRVLCEFFEGDALNHDHENWWVPNLAALVALCRAAGFRRVWVAQGPPRNLDRLPVGAPPRGYRAVLQAYA